jgi:DNA repair protein RAD5
MGAAGSAQVASLLGKAAAARGDTPVEEAATRCAASELDCGGGGVATDECPICLEPLDDTIVTQCAHQFCRECILALLSHVRTTAPCPLCREPVTRQSLMTLPRQSRFEQDLNDDTKWRSSAKIDALLDELQRAPCDAGPQGPPASDASTGKSIVFSQWTGMLDLVEVAMNKSLRGLRYVRLDGSMTVEERRQVMHRFRDDRRTRVLLLSLRAGCVGLNLTTASRVFLLDPWWNTALEEQAIGRVHRIGQTRPVEVVRFVVQGTVEERMLEMQRRKKSTAAALMFDDADLAGKVVAKKQMRMEELALCFEPVMDEGGEEEVAAGYTNEADDAVAYGQSCGIFLHECES